MKKFFIAIIFCFVSVSAFAQSNYSDMRVQNHDNRTWINEKYKEILNHTLNIEAMRKASEYLVGTHDFTSFSSSKIDPRKPRIKTITRIDIFEENQDIRFIYEGTGFLRYQVRMMTETLIMVGSNKIDIEEVKRILDKKDKSACRYNASPNGLYLVHVNY